MCKYCIHPDQDGKEFYYKKKFDLIDKDQGINYWSSLYYDKNIDKWSLIFSNRETTYLEVNYCPYCGHFLDKTWFDLGTIVSYFAACVYYLESLDSNIKLVCYDKVKRLIYVEYQNKGFKLSSATITVRRRYCSTEKQLSVHLEDFEELCDKLNYL